MSPVCDRRIRTTRLHCSLIGRIEKCFQHKLEMAASHSSLYFRRPSKSHILRKCLKIADSSSGRRRHLPLWDVCGGKGFDC